jgi:hypothetical protein
MEELVDRRPKDTRTVLSNAEIADRLASLRSSCLRKRKIHTR